MPTAVGATPVPTAVGVTPVPTAALVLQCSGRSVTLTGFGTITGGKAKRREEKHKDTHQRNGKRRGC